MFRINKNYFLSITLHYQTPVPVLSCNPSNRSQNLRQPSNARFPVAPPSGFYHTTPACSSSILQPRYSLVNLYQPPVVTSPFKLLFQPSTATSPVTRLFQTSATIPPFIPLSNLQSPHPLSYISFILQPPHSPSHTQQQPLTQTPLNSTLPQSTMPTGPERKALRVRPPPPS